LRLAVGLVLLLGVGSLSGRTVSAAVNEALNEVGDAAPDGTTAVELALEVDGKPIVTKGRGECNFTDDASIFEAPATMWAVRQSAGDRSVNLTMWRLRQGGETLTLSLTAGGKTYRVNTTKVGQQGAIDGTGRWTFAKSGAGGTFTIEALTAGRTKITGRLTCAGFTKPEDNG
jgi:hypothetical protein